MSFIRRVLSMPARIAAVAGVTLTQLVRMRLFLVPAAAAVLILALQFIPYQENISAEFRGVAQLEFLKDICLGCMQLFGLLFCVAATALLLPRDTEDRILYTILCKPVPRFAYLTGKALGVIALMVLTVGLMDALMVGLIELRSAGIAADLTAQLTANGFSPAEIQPYLDQVAEAGNTWNTQRGILASLLGWSVLTTFTLLISCVTSGSIVSIIFALGAYFIGLFRSTLFSTFNAGEGTGAALRSADFATALFLPDFSLFSVADAAAAGAALPWGLLGGLGLIGLCYMLLHLLTATWIFAHKEF